MNRDTRAISETPTEHQTTCALYDTGDGWYPDPGAVCTCKGRADVPVIVITRHPETETHVGTYETDVRVIVLDLGSGFDITHPDNDEHGEVREWIEAIRAEVSDLPADHEARAAIEDVIEQVREAFNIEDAETHCPHCGAGPADAEGELPHYRDCQDA